MTDVEAGLAREPHPFVNAHYMSRMEGRTVAICGKVDKVEAGSFTLRTSDDKEISVTGFGPSGDDQSQNIASGNSVEVRGTVGSDNQLIYSDLNRFDGDFDMGAYEQMLEYYHGICKHLTVSAE